MPPHVQEIVLNRLRRKKKALHHSVREHDKDIDEAMKKIMLARKTEKRQKATSQFKYASTGALVRGKLNGTTQCKHKVALNKCKQEECLKSYLGRLETLLTREMEALPKNDQMTVDDKHRIKGCQCIKPMPMALRKVELRGKDQGCEFNCGYPYLGK